MLFRCCFATCAGCTGAGITMVRALLLVQQARNEFVRILHPRAWCRSRSVVVSSIHG